jgi:hypothetical protein
MRDPRETSVSLPTIVSEPCLLLDSPIASAALAAGSLRARGPAGEISRDAICLLLGEREATLAGRPA